MLIGERSRKQESQNPQKTEAAVTLERQCVQLHSYIVYGQVIVSSNKLP